MSENIIKLEDPIYINNKEMIDRIDKTKFTEDLFCENQVVDIVSSNGTNQCSYTISLVYMNNTVCLYFIFLDENDVDTKYIVELQDDNTIISIIKSIVVDNKYVFDIDILKSKIDEIKDKIYDKFFEQKKIILFKNREIKCKYGLINNKIIFNRLYIEDNDFIIGEAVGTNKTFSECASENISFDICLDNNIILSIDNLHIKNRTKNSVNYVKIEKYPFSKWEYNNRQLDTNIEFLIGKDVKLPIIDKTTSNIYYLEEKLESENTNYDLSDIYKKNKKLSVVKINIFNYLLG